MDVLAADPYRAAARSLIEHGRVGPDHPDHLVQHPACAVSGQHETVYTRCCGKPVPLGRPMWFCEIPTDTGRSLDCCDLPFLMFGEG
jgi:hypothetical protein